MLDNLAVVVAVAQAKGAILGVEGNCVAEAVEIESFSAAIFGGEAIANAKHIVMADEKAALKRSDAGGLVIVDDDARMEGRGFF